MVLTNDERGWVMTVLSGIACVVGASVICVDIIVRQFPGKKNFRIQDSDSFLSLSLSLSFGVMLFSALYSMLPSSKRALQDGGYSPKEAAWIMIACFLGGVAGIQVISRYLHHLMPSHVVECEHTHNDDEEGPKEDTHGHSHGHHHTHEDAAARPKLDPASLTQEEEHQHDHSHDHDHDHDYGSSSPEMSQTVEIPGAELPSAGETSTQRNYLPVPGTKEPSRRPSLKQLFTSSISPLMPKKDHDDYENACFGFTEPCGQECFQTVSARGGFKSGSSAKLNGHAPRPATESTPLLSISSIDPPHSHSDHLHANHQTSSASSATLDANNETEIHKTLTNQSHADHLPDHHHHVPTNAFLSIGLQTSIAIALHKLPEGFITFATNHANPKLGVAVFLALFIHNITEGFALALPLYLALNNRFKAMAISFVLGGLSQPLGAGVAALWFALAGQGDWAPSEAVYGGMFAVTAGIMASVALSLFSESLDLTHSRTLCMVGAFTGMGILGISSALTA